MGMISTSRLQPFAIAWAIYRSRYAGERWKRVQSGEGARKIDRLKKRRQKNRDGEKCKKKRSGKKRKGRTKKEKECAYPTAY